MMSVHFLLVGYLFFWGIIGIDPGPRRLPFLGRLGLLFAVMPFHAFFGIATMTMTSTIGNQFYRFVDLPWLSSIAKRPASGRRDRVGIQRVTGDPGRDRAGCPVGTPGSAGGVTLRPAFRIQIMPTTNSTPTTRCCASWPAVADERADVEQFRVQLWCDPTFLGKEVGTSVHIEPGIVEGPKIILSYVTAGGAGAYGLYLAGKLIKDRGLGALLTSHRGDHRTGVHFLSGLSALSGRDLRSAPDPGVDAVPDLRRRTRRVGARGWAACCRDCSSRHSIYRSTA